MAKEKLIFVSHKHSDRDIAVVLANFIKNKSLGQTKVHLSSEPDFEGPRIGTNLNQQLTRTLQKASVVILLYTAADQDWSYCMWECGVALDPSNPDTNIMVFQCGRDIPGPFSDQVRTNARKPDDILRFVQSFYTEKEFFPEAEAPLTTFSPDGQEVKEAANELFKKLEKVLPELEAEVAEEWPAWPFLKIEVPLDQVESIENATADEQDRWVTDVIPELARVKKYAGGAEQMLGKARLKRDLNLSEMFDLWRAKNQEADSSWFEGMCHQIKAGALAEYSVIRIAHLLGPKGARYQPVLSRIQRNPGAGKMYFDVYFYNISDLRGIPVKDEMMTYDQIFSINMDEVPPDELLLSNLVKELDRSGRNRIPFFDALKHPKFMVHRSMIDKFIAQRSLDPELKDSDEVLTFGHVLQDREIREIIMGTIGFVALDASLANVKSVMDDIRDCRDVFITENGNKDEPVLGWVTNIMLGQRR